MCDSYIDPPLPGDCAVCFLNIKPAVFLVLYQKMNTSLKNNNKQFKEVVQKAYKQG